MFGFTWLTIRQAREALRHGQLEDAQRLLSQPALEGRRGVISLLGQVARGYVERGERLLRNDDAEGAWRDLLQAEQLRAGEKSCDRLRATLTRLGIAEVRALLEAGEPGRANEVLLGLRQRGVRSPELPLLEEATRGWLEAADLAARGDFALAQEKAERVSRLFHGALQSLEDFRIALDKRWQTFLEVLARLHEAAQEERWSDLAVLAEQMLVVAPLHPEARRTRARGWQVVEPVTLAVGAPARLVEEEEADGPPGDGLPDRFLLWIDGVGGYLVCTNGRLTFGQATLDARVDVPLVADVSRLHATLTRDGEGYLLEAVRPIQVNGQEVTRVPLRSGDRVTLGSSCQLLFRLPVPGSTTGRLDLVSGHRLPLGVDGILLMAETLVLGDVAQVHVPVPGLRKPVVLFRHRDGLGLRHDGTLQVNGQAAPARGVLPPQALVRGEEVSFAVEPASEWN